METQRIPDYDSRIISLSKHRGRWAVRVSDNWRITFKFDGPDAIDVNYEDYH